MEASDVLERLPRMAQAVERPQDAIGERHWRLVAFDPGDQGRGEVRLHSFAQCRELALQLAELGCIVKVCDGEGHERLWMWPPQ